ncbi:GNAT family N-acetyltransferase [Dysgonomonas sp. 25]|uniref:GNAT family N-acetyltransferase n=1 Tax=Dysgonomonas sp. 25 TaxID=2302933 RepID=UPI0013D4D330|nr:GNAT family N-acetyltransferase [Dysgonomonas sp. 25]NDV68316.1 N-acetyltransferase [Dysgonomonas sp. 25]
MTTENTNNTLSSDRVTLRSISETDVDAIFAYRSLESIARYQYWEPYTKDQAKEFVDRNKDAGLEKRGEWIGLAIIHRADKKLIGDCALKIEDTRAEIGCNISPDYQKQGLAKEVLRLLSDYCFNNTDVRIIEGITDSENKASIRLMESVGMAKVSDFEEKLICKGKPCVEYKYSLEKTKNNNIK